MAKNLVIVESPAKAKTIEGYLGTDFIVKSSYGHVADLPKQGLHIDIANGFAPHYEVSKDKEKVVSELRALAKKAEMIWLATDDDREGEAISWHLKETLGLDNAHTKRIVFREITKPAILKAIENPRTINQDLVNAQQARRVLDRLVGFELSPLLWKKIKPGLSAGRVQSVAVRIIVEREREIEAFQSSAHFKTTAIFKTIAGKGFRAELNKKFESEKEAALFLDEVKAASFSVKSLETKPAKKTPAPPFTTSTLQQEAANKLGFSVLQTMTLAQKLYEAGHISYMRTDSVNLSDLAIDAAAKQIQSAYGSEFVKTRKYKTKSESAQEAHEAVRPTDFAKRNAGNERNEQRLYELIWKRAIASQMADAELERTNVQIGISTRPELFQAQGEVIKFEGFLKVYIEHQEEEDELLDSDESEGKSAMLPPMEVNQAVNPTGIKSVQRFSKPSARYNEASLVKKLEEMNIGRPSTYAPTISTIIKREYIVKESREAKTRSIIELQLLNAEVKRQVIEEKFGSEKNKLFPTSMGMIVNDFLTNYFDKVVDYHFTSHVEDEFDKIAAGKVVWNHMIADFYKDFHHTVEESEQLKREDVNTSRFLGNHPETGARIIARLGRYGPVVQIGDSESGETPQYANLPKDELIETISLQKALDLFRLPKEVGTFEDGKMVVADGRFGPYIKHQSKFYSLPKGVDPHSVDEAMAVEIIVNKRKADAEKVIKEFDSHPDIKILNGRWGPYLAAGKQNIKLPKDKEPSSLTLDDCLALVSANPDPKAKAPSKTSAKPSSTKAKPKTTRKAKS